MCYFHMGITRKGVWGLAKMVWSTFIPPLSVWQRGKGSKAIWAMPIKNQHISKGATLTSAWEHHLLWSSFWDGLQYENLKTLNILNPNDDYLTVRRMEEHSNKTDLSYSLKCIMVHSGLQVSVHSSQDTWIINLRDHSPSPIYDSILNLLQE